MGSHSQDGADFMLNRPTVFPAFLMLGVTDARRDEGRHLHSRNGCIPAPAPEFPRLTLCATLNLPCPDFFSPRL